MAAPIQHEQMTLRSPLLMSISICLVLIISLISMPTERVTCQESLSPSSRRHDTARYSTFKGLQNENSKTENETSSDNQFGRVPHRSHHHARPPLGPIVSTYEQIVLAGSQVRLVCPHAVGHHLTPGANSFATLQTVNQQGLPNTKQQQQQQQPGGRLQFATPPGRDRRGETKAWTLQSSSGGGGLDSRIVSGANYNGHEQIRWFRNHVPLLNQERREQRRELLPAVVSRLPPGHGHGHGRQRRRNEFKLGRTTTTGTGRMGHALQPHPMRRVSGQSMDESEWSHQTDSADLSELNQTVRGRLRPAQATDEATRGGKEIATSLRGERAVAAFGAGLHQKLETEPLGELEESSGENVNELTSYEQSEPVEDSGESQMAQSDNEGGEGHGIERRLEDNWYVSKYGELVVPDVSARTAGRYTCLYAGQQSELILDVIGESGDGSGEPEGVTQRSRPVSPVVGDQEAAPEQPTRKRTTRRAEEGRARTPFWAAARSHAPPPPLPLPPPAARLPHFVESEIVFDADLKVIPGLMYTKQQLYCPVASRADLHRALNQHVHWLTRNFCTALATASHSPPPPPPPPHARGRSGAPVTLVRCIRLARQLVVRLLRLAQHHEQLPNSTDNLELSTSSDGGLQENNKEDKFFQIVWYKDNRVLDFHPDGRGRDKNINVKLINFIDQFKLAATTRSDSSNDASEDNENKAPEAMSSGSPRGPEQIDMSEPGAGPSSSSLREQGRQRRASESAAGHHHHHQQQQQQGDARAGQEQEGSLSLLLDSSPPSPLENLILEIDGIRRDKAGRYTCALQFNSAKLASLLERLKRMGSGAAAAAALADNRGADLHPDGIACPHGKRDKSKRCDPSAEAKVAAAAAAEQDTGRRHVRQISREQTQFDRGAPTKLTPLAPEIRSIEEETTLGVATSKATQLQSEIEADRRVAPFKLGLESQAFRGSRSADSGNELNAAHQGSGAKTNPMDEQLQQQQQSGSAIAVIGEIAGAKDRARDQQHQDTADSLARQISYLESILNGSISSEVSLNYIEQRIQHQAHTRPAAPVVALQTFALLISERPANSCSLWATINEANEAYSRRKFVDFEQLKLNRETFASAAPVTDDPMQAMKANGEVDLATNYEVEGEQTKGGDGRQDRGGEATATGLTVDGSNSLIKDASSAEEVLANRAFNYVNERNARRLNYPVGAPETMARSAARAKHTMRAVQSEARIRVKTRQNGQNARRTHSEPVRSRRDHETVTSPGDSRQMSQISNNDQLTSTGTSTKDNEISSGGNGDDDDNEELLWAASRYLYMHMRAYASSSLYGVQVDVEWSNEKQRHHLPYMNRDVMERDDKPAGMTIDNDERQRTSTSGRRQIGGQRRTWDGSDLAPFATIDLVAGQELHLQCTAQALGRLPDVKWYKRIGEVPESLPGHLKDVMLRRSPGQNQEILYWPLAHLDLLGPPDESETKFVCSQSLTIFDNLLNQTFTVISSLKMSHYTGGGGGARLAPDELQVDVGPLKGGELSPSLFACMVDADVRHQEATLSVRFRQAPSGKRLPIGLRNRLRARSLLAQGRQHKPLAPPPHSPTEMLNVDQVTGITSSRESEYDFLRRDSELFVPLSRSAVWLPLDRNGTYLGDNAVVALDSYGAGLASPIMLALVIAFLASSLVALVYLTLKSYRALNNFGHDADNDCGHASEMLQFGNGREREGGQPESQSSQADTLCEFNLKDSSVRHRMISEDDVTTSPLCTVNRHWKLRPSLCASPTGGSDESRTGLRDILMSGRGGPIIDGNNANAQRLYYNAHYHDLDPEYLFQELTGADTSDPSSQEMTTTCPPSCCALTMTHSTEGNMLELLSRGI